MGKTDTFLLHFYFREQKNLRQYWNPQQQHFTPFFGLGIPSKPNNDSGRILCLSVCLTGAVLFWSYSAGLVSYLTVEKYDFPINSMQVSGMQL